MAVFESLAKVLRALAIGDRVKVTLRPELMRFPNPVEGEVAEADGSGNFILTSAQGIVRINAGDVLSITALNR